MFDLDDITLKFNNSGFVVILGCSGSGKSTLLKLIGILDDYDRISKPTGIYENSSNIMTYRKNRN